MHFVNLGQLSKSHSTTASNMVCINTEINSVSEEALELAIPAQKGDGASRFQDTVLASTW